MPVPAARHGHRDGRRCTSSSSAASAAASSPASSPNAIGVRGTVIFLGVPTSIIGGLLLMNGARVHPPRPLARGRGAARGAGGAPQALRAKARARRCCRSPTSTSPTGRCRCCSTSNFEVQQGRDASRCSARTARASRRSCASISGLEVPERGVVRLNGRNITYVAPEQRAKHRASCSCPAATACSRASPSTRTSRSSARLERRSREPRSTSASASVLELFPELAGTAQAGRQQPVGRPAADARARPGADPRARDPADRRAVARARAGRRAAPARARRASSRRAARR